MDFRDLARMLGLLRLDTAAAEEIWKSPESVKGSEAAIHFGLRELVNGPLPSRVVIPLGGFTGLIVADRPRLFWGKNYAIEGGAIPLDDFPMPPEEVARRIGVPVLERAPE